MDETSRIVETILNDLVELVEKSEANDVLAASERRAASGKNYSDPILAELDDYFLNQCLSPSTDEDQDSEDQVVATNDDNESPFGRWRAWNWNNVRCDACRCKESLYWRRVARQLMVCNSCFFKKTYLILFNDEKFKKSGGVCTDQSSVEETSRTNKDTTSSSSTSSSKRKKSKQNSGQMSKKLASGDSSSRPLTRTALNGSAKNTNRSSPLPQPTNGGGSNGFTSQLSSSSASVKSEPQTASSTITTSSTNAGEDGSGSNDSKDLCSNENKPVQCLNVRKSARISQSRSKSRLKETNGDENSNNETQDIEMNGSSETSSTSTSKQQQSTSNQQQTTTNETNRRTKLFKNRKPNALRVKIEKPEPPLIYKIDPHEYAFHQGFLIKIGDIVALRRKKDSPTEDDECIYFAQIRAFLCDQYGEKSAVITWLIPVANGADYSPTRIRVPKDFEPSLFTLGPAEESPRPLHTLEFVYRPESVSTSLSNDYDYLNQYKSDLLRHKFELEDLSASNFRIIKSADSSNGLVVKHEFISNSL